MAVWIRTTKGKVFLESISGKTWKAEKTKKRTETKPVGVSFKHNTNPTKLLWFKVERAEKLLKWLRGGVKVERNRNNESV